MRECDKAELSVITAHPGITDTSEWQAITGKVHHCVVNTAAAERQRFQEFLLLKLIPRKQVGSQRLLPF